MILMTVAVNKTWWLNVVELVRSTHIMDSMTENSRILLEKMRLGCKYTYNELMKICDFTETQLCFAILYLLRAGKINQYRDTRVVYELIPSI